MDSIRSVLKPPLTRNAIIALFLLAYLTAGINTELKQVDLFPIPEHLLQDQVYYNRALRAALEHKDPYANRTIGTAYLYPPQALLIIEAFSLLQPFFLRVAIHTVLNLALLALIVHGIARYYGHPPEKIWYWYVLAFGFAPFLELLHIGQINIITMFGIFMLFIWEVKSPVLSGVGLSLGAMTKVSPLLFVAYLLVHKRYKVIVAAAVAIVVFSVLSILRYGLGPLLTYPDVFRGLLQQFLLTPNSQTLAAKLAVANYPEFQQLLSRLPQALSQPLAALVAALSAEYRIVQRTYVLYILLVLVLSAWLTLRGKQPREPLFILTCLGMMLAPNILWYHHYVFMLLPLLIWMGWRGLDISVVAWCCFLLLIVQIDRRVPPYGLAIHLFSNITMWIILLWQIRQFHPGKAESKSVAAVEPGA
jgi:hypothetical protein